MDYRNLQHTVLLDLLAKHTSHYMKAYTENANPDEVARLRDIILEIQMELSFRKWISNRDTISREHQTYRGGDAA